MPRAVLVASLVAGLAACSSSSHGGQPSDAGAIDAATADAGAIDALPADAGLVDAIVVDAFVNSTDAGPNDPTIVAGVSNHILLRGTVVTPDVTLDGEVLVVDDVIACVDSGSNCEMLPEAADATIVDTKGIIAPGLIDTHNHILFDVFDDDDWYPAQIYQDHDQWPAETGYAAMLDVKQCIVNDSQGKPDWCAQTPYGTPAGSLRCEVDKFGELKGLIAGTTSIVGLPGTSAACFGSLARSIDVAQNGLPKDEVQTSALFPPSSPSTVCSNFTSGKTKAYLVHVGEGDDANALGEFARLGSLTTPANCLYAPQTAITHGTAFTINEFTTMANAGMKLIWSPQSNVSLYGQTADIPTALGAGVTIALAPDWSMGGSQNMLDELRFAAGWDHDHWNDRLSSQDLVTMGTEHAAQVLALDDTLGTLAVGHLADIAVFAGDTTQPFDAIVAAQPSQVRLVMVGGVPLYGDRGLVAAAPSNPGCEMIDICGVPKFMCVATSDSANKLNQTYAEISSALSAAMVAADALTTTDSFNFSPLTPLVKCH